MAGSHELAVARCCQVLACLAAAIVAGMTIQSGAAIHQQIKRSVHIDSAMHDSAGDTSNVSRAASKLNGMLYTGLALTVLNVCMAILTFVLSTSWLALATLAQLRVHAPITKSTWALLIQQYPWDGLLGAFWFILASVLWLFRKVIRVWIFSDGETIKKNPMLMVLVDGVACFRCPAACGCNLKGAEENLKDIFNLLTASYVVGVVLMACSAAALKALAKAGDSSGAQHGTAGYSVLPVTDPAGGSVLAGSQQQSSAELCLLSVQSDAADEQPHSTA